MWKRILTYLLSFRRYTVFTNFVDEKVEGQNIVLNKWFGKSPFSKLNSLAVSHKIQYLGGTPDDRKIVIDDTNLVTKINRGWKWKDTPGYGRTQISFATHSYKVKRLLVNVGMKLSKNFNKMLILSNGWGPVIFEIFNDATWNNSDTMFRIIVELVPDKSNDCFRFQTKGQILDKDTKKYHTIWSQLDTSYKLYPDKFITISYLIEDGIENGKFDVLVMDKHEVYSVCQIRGITRHPALKESQGYLYWQPIKMYMSKNRADTGPYSIKWSFLDMKIN